MFGPVPTGFSIMYLNLRSDGILSPVDALAFLFSLEERGWVEVRRFEGDFRPNRHKWKVASKRYRHDFVKEHEDEFRKLEALTREPRWNQDPDLDYGPLNLHFAITDGGKAEYLRREGPTKDEDAWKAEDGKGEMRVWAPTERIARRAVRKSIRLSYRPPEGTRITFRKLNLEPATFGLATGERFEGVCVTYKLRVVPVADHGRA